MHDLLYIITRNISDPSVSFTMFPTFWYKKAIKETVHPKMKIQTLFTNPHAIPNRLAFFCRSKKENL